MNWVSVSSFVSRKNTTHPPVRAVRTVKDDNVCEIRREKLQGLNERIPQPFCRSIEPIHWIIQQTCFQGLLSARDGAKFWEYSSQHRQGPCIDGAAGDNYSTSKYYYRILINIML